MFYLRFFLIGIVLVSCEKREWFKKEYSEIEQKQLAQQLLRTRGAYYQGSVAEQYLFEEGLNHDSTNAGLWQGVATPYLKRGYGKEAFKAYDQAVKNDPDKWQGFRGYIYLYFYRDYGRAIADFNATDTLTKDFIDHPQGQSVDYMRGICYYGLTDYNKALAYFNKYVESVIAKEGEAWVDPYAVLYRGLTFEKLGLENRAFEEFDRATRIYPNLSDPLYHKARILAKNENYTQAKNVLQEAREYFQDGYYHQRPYVEVLEQIYLIDLERLEEEIESNLGVSRLEFSLNED